MKCDFVSQNCLLFAKVSCNLLWSHCYNKSSELIWCVLLSLPVYLAHIMNGVGMWYSIVAWIINRPVYSIVYYTSGGSQKQKLLANMCCFHHMKSPTKRYMVCDPLSLAHLRGQGYIYTHTHTHTQGHYNINGQPRWLRGLMRSRVHSLWLLVDHCVLKNLGSNPGQGSKGINFSGWHGLDMSVTVTKRR